MTAQVRSETRPRRPQKNVKTYTLKPTPLFRAGTWLLLNAAICAWAWRKRHAPAGAFVVAVSGSAVVYVLTFFFVGVAAEFRYALWAVIAGLIGALPSIRRSPAAPAASGVTGAQAITISMGDPSFRSWITGMTRSFRPTAVEKS
jgi:hypothetical protein